MSNIEEEKQSVKNEDSEDEYVSNDNDRTEELI